MKSIEKLDLLREAGFEPKLAEAIVRTQEASDYITKDYLDARLGELEHRVVDMLTVRMLGIVTLAIVIVGLLDKFVRP